MYVGDLKKYLVWSIEHVSVSLLGLSGKAMTYLSEWWVATQSLNQNINLTHASYATFVAIFYTPRHDVSEKNIVLFLLLLSC
jgi:hypothetical protein